MKKLLLTAVAAGIFAVTKMRDKPCTSVRGGLARTAQVVLVLFYILKQNLLHKV